MKAGVIHMRHDVKQLDRRLVHTNLTHDPLSLSLFVFINRRNVRDCTLKNRDQDFVVPSARDRVVVTPKRSAIGSELPSMVEMRPF